MGNQQEEVASKTFKLDGGVLHLNDSRKIKDLIIDNSIDFVVTSPPYWAIRNYGFKHQIGFGQTYEDYIHDLKLVFEGCFKALKESRWIAINVGTVVSNEGMKFLAGDIVMICQNIDFN